MKARKMILPRIEKMVDQTGAEITLVPLAIDMLTLPAPGSQATQADMERCVAIQSRLRDLEANDLGGFELVMSEDEWREFEMRRKGPHRLFTPAHLQLLKAIENAEEVEVGETGQDAA